MKRSILVLQIIFCLGVSVLAQLPDSCKLRFGTNLSGLSDWGSEQPFVDMMRSARTWYTKDVGNPNGGPFDTGVKGQLSFRPDGYPTHIPQTIPAMDYPQAVATIWGSTSGWEPGSYTLIHEGTGELLFWGAGVNVLHPTDSTYSFEIVNPIGNVFEVRIESSDINDPIRNIRIVKNDYLNTYKTQPFNPIWLEKVKMFKSVRFMDWGQTNNWHLNEPWDWEHPDKYGWEERAKPGEYTWATNRGIPYELMIKLMNDYNLDGWVCVPHNVDDGYIQQMAQLFHDNLEPGRKLTVEYSNEIWNWIFGQAQWLNKYGCIDKGVSWPEGTVPYIQNCMDIWSEVFKDDMSRITRAVGIQTGWLDVAQRTAFNMVPGSFDVVAGTYYFGLSDYADQTLDNLGATATVQDVVGLVRSTWHESKQIIKSVQTELADSLGLPLAFYEGGQHLTPNPFGVEPTYAQALLDVQRDTAIYNLYNEWFDFLRTLQKGDEPLQCMNFSLIAERSARYGSWGIWETMFQDTTQIPAPKLKALIENIFNGCDDNTTLTHNRPLIHASLKCYPNPTTGEFVVIMENGGEIHITDILGRPIASFNAKYGENKLDARDWPQGIYLVRTSDGQLGKMVKSAY
ncbi:MAG TPA: T9SS type A sorting domain-containing protein [Saprospiraceae bacterium]|nr:T9SS type A sorting domain-containing protein [Saprospiraceae bacterium]HNE66224.1 T9SS type A sorting domain-containing protein [Saprospiraceae bacterium]